MPAGRDCRMPWLRVAYMAPRVAGFTRNTGGYSMCVATFGRVRCPGLAVEIGAARDTDRPQRCRQVEVSTTATKFGCEARVLRSTRYPNKRIWEEGGSIADGPCLKAKRTDCNDAGGKEEEVPVQGEGYRRDRQLVAAGPMLSAVRHKLVGRLATLRVKHGGRSPHVIVQWVLVGHVRVDRPFQEVACNA
jgi:hypothetical protein